MLTSEEIIRQIEGNLSENEKELWNLLKVIGEENLPYAIKRWENKILSFKNQYLSYLFASKIKGADINKHAVIVINGNNPELNYLFAKNTNSTLINEHAKIVIDSNNPELNYLFAVGVKNASIDEHAKIVIDSNNPELNYLFAKNTDSSLINEHAKVVIDSKNPELNYFFACCVKNAPINELAQVVIDSRNMFYNRWFIENIKSCDRLAHTMAILKTEASIDKGFIVDASVVLEEELSYEELLILEFELSHDLFNELKDMDPDIKNNIYNRVVNAIDRRADYGIPRKIR